MLSLEKIISDIVPNISKSRKKIGVNPYSGYDFVWNYIEHHNNIKIGVISSNVLNVFIMAVKGLRFDFQKFRILEILNFHPWGYHIIVRFQIRKLFSPITVIVFLPININVCFGCSKELSHRDGSFEYPQHMFWLRSKIFFFFQIHVFSYIEVCISNIQGINYK